MSARRNASKNKRNNRAKPRSQSTEKENKRRSKTRSKSPRLKSSSKSRSKSWSKSVSRSRSHSRPRIQKRSSSTSRTKKQIRQRSPIPVVKRLRSRTRSRSRSRSRPRSRSRSHPRPQVRSRSRSRSRLQSRSKSRSLSPERERLKSRTSTKKGSNIRPKKQPHSTTVPKYEQVRIITPLVLKGPSGQYHTKQSQTQAQTAKGDPSRLYIGNLMPHIGVEHLRYFFERFGHLIDISVQPRPLKGLNFAFVQYAKKEQAARALEDMTGASIDGQPITIEYARPKRPISFFGAHGRSDTAGLHGPGTTRQMDVRAIPELRGVRSIHDLNFRGTTPIWSGLPTQGGNNWRNLDIDQRSKIRRMPQQSFTPSNRTNDHNHNKRGFKRKREIKRSQSRSKSRGKDRGRNRSRSRSTSRDREARRFGKSQVVVRDGKRRVVLRDSTTDAVDIEKERWRPAASSPPRNKSPVRVTNSRRPLSPIGGALGRKSSHVSHHSRSGQRPRSPLRKLPPRSRANSRRSRSRSPPRTKDRKKLSSDFTSRNRSRNSRSRSRSKGRRPDPRSHDGGTNEGRRVHVRNLSSRTTGKDLRKALHIFGKVADAWIVNDSATQKCKGFGFVDFESKTTALRALRSEESIYILDKKISILPAKPQRDEHILKTRLHLRNLTFNSTGKDIRRALGKYGEVTDAWIVSDSPTNKREGFADFASDKDAQRALRDQRLVINDRQIHLNYARRVVDIRPTSDMISTRLRVRNLTYETSSRELRQAFLKYGNVVDAWIVKDKTMTKSTGVGFVEFASSRSATIAMKQSRIVINGRRVHAHYAKINATISSRTSLKIRQRNNTIMPNYANLGMPDRPMSFPMGPPGRMMGGPMSLSMLQMPPTGMMNSSLPQFYLGQPMGGPLLRTPSPFLGPGLSLPPSMRTKSLIRPLPQLSRMPLKRMPVKRMPVKRMPAKRKK